MAKEKAAELNNQLFEKVSGIKLNDPAAIFGTTSSENILRSMRKHVVELGQGLAAKKPYEETMQTYETVVGDIDTAGVTGLIGEAELTDYYKLTDKLWAAIEREK